MDTSGSESANYKSKKFSGKVWKIFWTQPFGLGQISFYFVSFVNEIFCPSQILQLLTSEHYFLSLFNIFVRKK